MVFINIKSSYKGFTRGLIATLLFLLCTFINLKPVIVQAVYCSNHGNANWWSCPYEFYNYFDIANQRIAKYDLTGNSGSFYFGQTGVVKTSTYDFYRIIGFNFSVSNGGNTYYGAMNLQDFNISADDVIGSKIYSLWNVSYSTLINALKYYNPNVDFSFLYNRSFSTTVKFDAIVSRFLNNVPQGSADRYGWTSGTVITSLNDPDWPSYVAVSERKELYGIIGFIPAESKPQLAPPSTYATLIAPGTSGWEAFPTSHYHVAGSADYWVNLKDEFTVYTEASIATSDYSSSTYPDYQYFGLSNGSSDDIRIYAYGGTNQWISHSGWSSHFRGTESDLWGSSNEWSTYLIGHFRMIATKDAQTYKLSSAAVKSGNASNWKDAGQNLKTDGTAPTSSSAQSSKLLNSDSLYVEQKGIYDNGSGLNATSPYALIYFSGATDKGAKIALTKASSYFDYSATVNVSTHLPKQSGTVIVEVHALDNVGNDGIVSTYNFDRSVPVPYSGQTLITKYDYEDDTTKWVKASTEFAITNTGHSTAPYVISRSRLGISPYSSYSLATLNYSAFMNNSSYQVDVIGAYFSESKFSSLVHKSVSTENSAEGIYYLKASTGANGRKFYVHGKSELDYGGSTYSNSWTSDPKMLGIDSKGPTITVKKVGRTSIEVSAVDNESGLKSMSFSGSKGQQTITDNKIILNSAEGKYSVVSAIDNVGNYNTLTLDYQETKVTATLIPEIVTDDSGKVKMLVTSRAIVTNPIPGEDITFSLLSRQGAFGNTNPLSLVTSQVGSLNYSFYVYDYVNQTFGPNVAYSTDGSTYAKISFDRISDLLRYNDFSINSKYPSDSYAITEATLHKEFSSGEDRYRYVLYRESDNKFVTLATPLKISEGETTTTSLDMSAIDSGDFKVEVTMLDKNGNPSGTTTYKFRHTYFKAPEDIGLAITAIKDVNWKTELYPLSYKDYPNSFPVGLAYRYDSVPIKLGYAVNFSIDDPSSFGYRFVSVDYKITDPSGKELDCFSGDKSLEELDSTLGYQYLKQFDLFGVTDGKLRFKHFLPANTIFYNSLGQVYSGDVVVSVKFNLTNGSVPVTKEYQLYSFITDDTALDDLYIDKQR